MISNGDFESAGLAPWTLDAGARASLESGWVLGGLQSVKLANGTGALSQSFAVISDAVNVSFTFSGDDPGGRNDSLLQVVLSGTGGAINFRVNGDGDLQTYNGSTWVGTGIVSLSCDVSHRLSLTIENFGAAATYDIIAGTQSASDLAVFSGGVLGDLSSIHFPESQSAGAELLLDDIKIVHGAKVADAQFVAQVQATSLARREELLRSTTASPSVWPHNLWGDTMWCLSALTVNEQVDDANARLLQYAQNFVALFEGSDPAAPLTAAQKSGIPWPGLTTFDYARILWLFHSESPYYPGRLEPATEAAMKEAVWQYCSRRSIFADNGLEDLYLLLGTENHDLNHRPFDYLMLALLSEDPAYSDQVLADGHSISEHVAAYTQYFREWPRHRATAGLWIEIGSTGYQKYAWPALFNLYELAPDPVVREQFGKYLDLTFIEEEQVSVGSRRGGGRSRAKNQAGEFEASKNLLIAPTSTSRASSHNRTVETSRYVAPAAAILLRAREFPVSQPFVIRNRVPGEYEPRLPEDVDGSQRIRHDSAQANYADRTPHYQLGSTLIDPTLRYAGISWQNRACGLLFDNPDTTSLSEVYPYLVPRENYGRPQNPHFSVQHENVLLLQRIGRGSMEDGGSYSVEQITMRFKGADLQILDQGGWIFTTNGKGHVAVIFLDGGHTWNADRTEALPANYTGTGDTGRILIHAGDITTQTFEEFRTAIVSNSLVVTSSNVDYHFGSPQQRIQVQQYDWTNQQNFTQPLINGAPLNLRPSAANPLKTFDSPYLSMDYGSDVVSVNYPVGSETQIDFGFRPQTLLVSHAPATSSTITIGSSVEKASTTAADGTATVTAIATQPKLFLRARASQP
jgi:hypothetical protein